MSSQVCVLIAKALVLLVVYTLVLSAARRWAGQRGYAVTAALMSVAWWLVFDAGFAILSYVLTVTAYTMWFPSEYLEDLPLIGGWFANSDLCAADWLALILTGLAFSLAHGVAWYLMLISEIISMGRAADYRPLVRQGLPLVLTAVTYSMLMYWWESPVLALRTAEMVCESDLVDNVGSIQSVREIVGTSWVLRSLYWMWPMLILYISHKFTNAFLQMENAIQHGPAEPAEVPAIAARPVGERPGAPVPQGVPARPEPQRPVQPMPVPLEGQAVGGNGDGPRHVPDLPPLEPLEAPVEGRGRNGGRRDHADEDPGIQELLDQLEAERRERAQAELERDALAHQHAVNPLNMPNREAGEPALVAAAQGDDEDV